MSRLELRKIAHSFDGRSVLHDLSLQVDNGEYVVVVGASGCGKTTLLRIIAGIQTPQSGEVFLGDRNVTSWEPRRRDVAMVFQQDGLYPNCTVEKSLRIALRGRVPRAEIASRIERVGRLTGVESLLDRYPDQLSGGQLRRAAVAKSLVRETSVRLLDEPMSALDAAARYSMQQDLLRWHHEVGGTTIHVTHDGHEAMRLADRIAVIDAGAITQFGAPVDLYQRPAHLAVARLIGIPPMNLVAASVGDASITVSDSEVQIRVPERPLRALQHGDCWVGVRPGRMRVVSSDDSESNAGAWPESLGDEAGLVIAARVLGTHQVDDATYVDLKSGRQDWLLLNRSPMTFTPGMTMVAFAPFEDIHLFDASSGQRIPSDDE